MDVVLLTMKDRPKEEALAQKTLLAQTGVELRVCLVGNGCIPQVVPPGAITVALPENIGIPGGRNAGARALGETEHPGDYLFFLVRVLKGAPRRDEALSTGARRKANTI
ncbi:hypothetical protein [Streptomyces sp. NPDC005969]|uniref:glycosyltransferase family 2 protein n=1 Tax=Streptomyces sp. NPDC005969 TaxID=3156722 RepID=UPI0033CB76EC